MLDTNSNDFETYNRYNCISFFCFLLNEWLYMYMYIMHILLRTFNRKELLLILPYLFYEISIMK